MAKYLMTFTNHKATALVEFNNEGWLIKYELTPGTFGEDQFYYITRMFPYTIKRMQHWLENKFPNVKIQEVQDDLSFDAFYDTYAHKISKRSVAENIWKKMPDTERAKAIKYISTYDRHVIQTGVNKKYPETYLNSEMWNN